MDPYVLRIMESINSGGPESSGKLDIFDPNIDEPLQVSLFVSYGIGKSPVSTDVISAVSRKPWGQTIASLREFFEVNDSTDPRDCVGARLLLNGQGMSCCLRLSMVGGYYAIEEVRNFDGDNQSSPLIKILKICNFHGWRYIDDEDLLRQDIGHLWRDGLHLTVYEALFQFKQDAVMGPEL